MFIKEKTGIKLLSVLEVAWGETNTSIKGRAYHALSFRVQGNSTVTQRGHSEDLTTGDVLFMPQKADYKLKSGAEKIIVAHFEADDELQRRFRVYRPENAAALQRSFTKMLEIWNRKLPGYYFGSMSVFYNILRDIEESHVGKHGADYEKIRRAVEFMHLHYTDPELEVRLLCEKAFMSDTYFRRLFCKIYGQTPIKYINHLRVEYAKELLREWHGTVGQIALQSGFSDAKYFSTVFRQHTGQTPSEYQRSTII